MKRLEILDYARFFAAIIVVLFHYTFNGITNGKITSISHTSPIAEMTKYGYLGVELFFMISGYVIFFSAKSASASRFVVSRAVRLYPAYWFAVLFTSFFAMQMGGDLMAVRPTQIVANLTMMQSFFGVDHVDGVYWTLVYEITFYFAVFILLLFGFQRQLNAVFIFWPMLFIIAMLFKLQSIPYMGDYYYFFSAGALFAVLRENFTWPPVVSLFVSYLFCIKFSTENASALALSKGVEFSPVIVVFAVTMFFALFLLQNTKKAQSLQLPMSRTAGSLTYPIYLIHAHFGYMLLNKFATENNKLIVYLATITTVVIVAIFINNFIEQRYSRLWKTLFTKTAGNLIDSLQRSLSNFLMARKSTQPPE